MKIGITGIANGGKTVFLTSLLWHLEELNPSTFSLPASMGVSAFKSLNKDVKKNELFPFQLYKERLARGGKWPVKTNTGYTYRCSIRRKDWAKINARRFSRLRSLQFSDEQVIEFFDFPGERIADAAIAAFDDFGAWSDHILQYFQSHLDYNTSILPFLQLQEELVVAFSENTRKKVEVEHILEEMTLKLVSSYKLTLATLIHSYKPLISPSTFLLGEKGDVAPMCSKEELAKLRFSGLTEETQFVPLTEEMRGAYPRLAKEMARYYRAYRKKIAFPLFQKIIQSNSLVILLDIPSLLKGGVGRYNDNRQILINLFEAIEPQSFLGALLQNIQSFLGFGLEKIAFVAVKADLVHPQDIENGRLEALLTQMTARIRSLVPEIEVGTFICSAVHSTRKGASPYHLIGTPVYENKNNQEMEFPVSALPETWPDSWEFGDFQFVDVRSASPTCLMNPPKQIGLDRVFSFLISDRK